MTQDLEVARSMTLLGSAFTVIVWAWGSITALLAIVGVSTLFVEVEPASYNAGVLTAIRVLSLIMLCWAGVTVLVVRKICAP